MAITKLLATVFLCSVLLQTARADDAAWDACRAMIGTWSSFGEPEKGSGTFSLTPDLNGKVLVRRHHADLPAADGRPATKHEDLMVIYKNAAGKDVKAIYFDNEGHTINYTATASPDKNTLSFLSDAAPSAPRFRLTYTKGEGDTMSVGFEIAQPGKPDAFKMYVQGKVRRQHHNNRE